MNTWQRQSHTHNIKHHGYVQSGVKYLYILCVLMPSINLSLNQFHDTFKSLNGVHNRYIENSPATHMRISTHIYLNTYVSRTYSLLYDHVLIEKSKWGIISSCFICEDHYLDEPDYLPVRSFWTWELTKGELLNKKVKQLIGIKQSQHT